MINNNFYGYIMPLLGVIIGGLITYYVSDKARDKEIKTKIYAARYTLYTFIKEDGELCAKISEDSYKLGSIMLFPPCLKINVLTSYESLVQGIESYTFGGNSNLNDKDIKQIINSYRLLMNLCKISEQSERADRYSALSKKASNECSKSADILISNLRCNKYIVQENISA